jgi:hypothetical protein
MYWTNPLQGRCVLHPQALKSGGAIWSDPTGSHPSLTVDKDENADMLLEGFIVQAQIASRTELAALLTKMAAAACLPTPRIERRPQAQEQSCLMFAQGPSK